MTVRARILQSVLDEIERHQLARQPITSTALDQAIAGALAVDAHAKLPPLRVSEGGIVKAEPRGPTAAAAPSPGSIIRIPETSEITEIFTTELGIILGDLMITSRETRGDASEDADIILGTVQLILDLIADSEKTSQRPSLLSPVLSSPSPKRRIDEAPKSRCRALDDVLHRWLAFSRWNVKDYARFCQDIFGRSGPVPTMPNKAGGKALKFVRASHPDNRAGILLFLWDEAKILAPAYNEVLGLDHFHHPLTRPKHLPVPSWLPGGDRQPTH